MIPFQKSRPYCSDDARKQSCDHGCLGKPHLEGKGPFVPLERDRGQAPGRGACTKQRGSQKKAVHRGSAVPKTILVWIVLTFTGRDGIWIRM